MKAEYILIFSDYISWENEQQIDRFEIGVYGAPGVFNELSFKAQTDNLKGKPFQVKSFRRLKDFVPVQLLFVGKDKNQDIKKVFSSIKGQPVLLITDSCNVYDYVMINMLTLNSRIGKPFELNKSNIDQAGLTVSSRILYFGGREDDLREIYKISERQLEEVNNELDALNVELELQYRLMENRKQEIDSLNIQIISQKNELKSLFNDIDRQTKSLAEKSMQLEQQESDYKKLVGEIGRQEKQLSLQRDSIAAGMLVLQVQHDSIKRQQDEIRAQESILGKQSIIIERQQSLLYFFLTLLLLVSGMVFFMIRAYRIKKRANRILREKNDSIAKQNIEISKQKEEILAQREQLEIINREIEKQNENIKASIYYALTIQQSILPLQDEMDKSFESFTIYLPRDIVSGDFYWFSHVKGAVRDREITFLAVVDCTGHGVPGGFLSMIGARMLSTIINENHIYDPEKVLKKMDKNFRLALQQDRTENDDGMDVCLCRIERDINPENNKNGQIKVVFSGARRPLYYYKNGSGVEMIKGDRKTVGGRFNKVGDFSQQEIIMNKGDKIYLTTDGLTDQPSPQREKFGINRLLELLSETGNYSIQEQRTRIEEELLGFMKYEDQRDDITLIGVKL